MITAAARDVNGGTLFILKFDVALAFLVLQWDCVVSTAAAENADVLFGANSSVALRYLVMCITFSFCYAKDWSCSGACRRGGRGGRCG